MNKSILLLLVLKLLVLKLLVLKLVVLARCCPTISFLGAVKQITDHSQYPFINYLKVYLSTNLNAPSPTFRPPICPRFFHTCVIIITINYYYNSHL
jgi:hypothetical protein